MKDIVTQLRTNSECLAPSIMLAAADEIEQLRAERDEARRVQCLLFENMVSVMTTGSPFAPPENARRHAKAKGWDCFDKLDKENTDA
jgi:hypothetical protein